MVVLPKGAKAKDPRAAPGSVLPTDSSDLKVLFNPRRNQIWPFLVQQTGLLLGAVVRVLIRYFLGLLRGTSLRF